MKAVPRGGRVRFVVESKSFEILIDESGDKLRGCIWERSKGITSWIRFGDVSLGRLLAGVEFCCRGGEDKGWSHAWEEEGRSYRLEKRLNEAGRFIFCSVRDVEAKRFCLIFPEGKGLSGGWNILAEKLREVGVVPIGSLKIPLFREVQKKELELETRTYADVTKSRAGKIGDKLLDRCLVGRWENGVNLSLELDFLKHWVGQAWLLKGNLNIDVLGGGLLLFEFELSSEAERVLSRGKRRVKDNELILEKWHPEVGCLGNKVMVKEAWVRVVGLPLHLWSREVFKLIGDGCGGLINVDENTFSMANLQWARLLVRVEGRDFPSSVQLVEGSGCYSIQLWWEVQPWYSQVMPAGSGCRKGDTETEDEEGSGLGDVCRGNVLEKEAQLVEQMGIQSEPPCGSSSKGATVLSMEPAARGPGVEETYGEDRLENRGQGAGKGVIRGGVGLGPAAIKVGPDSGEAQFRSRLGVMKSSPDREEAQLFGLEEAKPIILKGWQMGCEEKPFYIKGSLVGWAGLAEMGCGPAKEGLKGIRAFSLADEVEMGARATVEDSRSGVRDDEGIVCCHGGDQRASEDSSMVALVVRGTSGLDENVVGVGYQTPLCAVMKDGSPWLMDSGKEKSKGNNMSDVVEVMQERMDLGNKWDECSLVKFKKALGFSIKVLRGNHTPSLKPKTEETKARKGNSNVIRGGSSLGVGRLEWELWMLGEVLELMGLEVGLFSISCRFKNVEDGFDGLSQEFEGPPFKGAVYWSGGLNNQTMSRIDRFTVTEDRECYFNGCFILGEIEGTKSHLKILEQRGFGEVGVNKKLALDKVDWDNREKGRVLSMEEPEARKEAKENFENGFSWRKFLEAKIKRGVVEGGRQNIGFFIRWPTLIEGKIACLRLRIDGEEAARLEEVFTEEEVFSALSDMNGDKAPGPDGFSLSFWQFSWEFVKVEVMGFFKEFHERGRFVRSLNSTFLVLIPKKAGAEDLRDFRPISLVGGYLKRSWERWCLHQNAFIERRQILDAALIANEAIDSMLKKKAYDHLNWNFLLSILQRMGFGERWTGWISWCISTRSFQVLINGTLEGFFNSSRVEEATGSWFLICRHDDTLVFCDSSQDEMAYLSWLLMWFEALSGLRINLDKSEILPVGRVENLELLALEVGCKVGRLPTSYLGIPLGANHKSVAVWDGVEERFRKRLAKWKRQFISKGGRMTLIRVPCQDFYGRRSFEEKPHLVKWDTVCLAKSKGGLGVRRLSILNRALLWLGLRDLKDFNHALLGKWLWRFPIERESFWRRVIVGKFGEVQGGIHIGNGRRTRFWWDMWVGDSKLKDLFPLLFRIAANNSAIVADLWGRQEGGGGGWEVHFRRPFQDWELEEVNRFWVTFLQ
ncbi:hypothetical protein AAG906_018977 [Vitis piasezkii]